MTQLSVNINKIATLRNARGGDTPNVLQAALAIEKFGAHGITVHPRPDERHIRLSDVYELSKQLSVEFNIEGFPSAEYMQLVKNTRPAQATLVPDPPEVITSNAGWKIESQMNFLTEIVGELKSYGSRVSLFIDPYDYLNSDMSEIAATGCDRIELYTEKYAQNFSKNSKEETILVYAQAAIKAQRVGLAVNAGHDLSLENLSTFIQQVPHIAEVSIGHALISDALYLGLEATVAKYLGCLIPSPREAGRGDLP